MQILFLLYKFDLERYLDCSNLPKKDTEWKEIIKSKINNHYNLIDKNNIKNNKENIFKLIENIELNKYSDHNCKLIQDNIKWDQNYKKANKILFKILSGNIKINWKNSNDNDLIISRCMF